jgi:hypothetical protein
MTIAYISLDRGPCGPRGPAPGWSGVWSAMFDGNEVRKKSIRTILKPEIRHFGPHGPRSKEM